MGTRSKVVLPSSPTISTRSKRRLSLWFVTCLLNLLIVCETNTCLNSHSSTRPYLCMAEIMVDLCETLFMWDLVNCNACVKILEHIIYCYVSYLLNITPNMCCYVYYILQICPTLCVNLFAYYYFKYTTNYWQPKLTIMRRSELLTSTRTSDFHVGVLALCENQNFWPPTRTFDLRMGVLALHETQNFLNPC
jgi:hypothetical protein